VAERIHIRCPFCSSLRRLKRDGYRGINDDGPLEFMSHEVTNDERGRLVNHWRRIALPVSEGSVMMLDGAIAKAEGVLRRLVAEREAMAFALGLGGESSETEWLGGEIAVLSEESTWQKNEESSWVRTVDRSAWTSAADPPPSATASISTSPRAVEWT